MSEIKILQKGESGVFYFGRKNGGSISGWTCVIEVRSFPGDAAVIGPRTITETLDNAFKAILTESESDTLTAGTTYRIAARLAKAGTDEEEQNVQRFKIGSAWI